MEFTQPDDYCERCGDTDDRRALVVLLHAAGLRGRVVARAQGDVQHAVG